MIFVKKQFLSLVMAVLVVTGFAGVLAPSTALAADTIGYVNADAILQRHPSFESAVAALQLEQQNAQKEFESKADKLDEKGRRDLQQTLSERVAKRENDLISPIRKSIRVAIANVAKAQGLSVVLQSGTVLYGGKDITEDVAKEVMNKK